MLRRRKLLMLLLYLGKGSTAALIQCCVPRDVSSEAGQHSSSTCSPSGRVRMRGKPAAAADSPSSLSALLLLGRRLTGGPAPTAAGSSSAPPLLPPPNTVFHSSGMTPDEAGTRNDATLLAVAYLDRSSTSFGARLRGTPQPTGATERAEGGLLLLALCGCAFLPNSSTRPAMDRWPAPGVPGGRGAGAATLPALPGDAPGTGDVACGCTGCCCCCSPGSLRLSWLY